MNRYVLSGFGELDLDNLDDYYDAEMEYKDRNLALDVNFDEYSIDANTMNVVTSIIQNMASYDSRAVTAMEQDYGSGDTVKPYLAEHSDLFDGEEPPISKLYLKRVGFYPENEEQFAVFDYTLGEDLTQYLVVVNFRKGGEIDNLTMES